MPEVVKEKKRILFMLPALTAGGAERTLISFANNLNVDEFEARLVSITQDGPARNWVQKNVPIDVMNSNFFGFGFFKLIQRVNNIKPDIIFSTMPHCNALAILTKLLFPKIRVIVREAALPNSILSSYGIKGHLSWFIYKILYPRADMVISNSTPMFEQFQTDFKLPMNNHVVLFNPVDTKRITSFEYKNCRVTQDCDQLMKFVAVGRLIPEKGFDRLLVELGKADFKRLWKLDIIGEGPTRSQLESLIKEHKLHHNVSLRGYFENPWIIAANADCLLLPSRWEGMPNVVLEGLSLGVPAIAMRDAGGIVDIAKYAAADSLKIVDSINEFVNEMNNFEPAGNSRTSNSLLPDEFSMDTIMKQFKTILMG